MHQKKRHINHYDDGEMDHFTDWLPKTGNDTHVVKGIRMVPREEQQFLGDVPVKMSDEPSPYFIVTHVKKKIDPNDWYAIEATPAHSTHHTEGEIDLFSSIVPHYIIRGENVPLFTRKDSVLQGMAGAVGFWPQRKKIFRFYGGGFVPALSFGINQELETSIQKAESIVDLPDNWDDDGAKVITKELFDSAVSFLRNYHMFLQNSGYQVPVPEINPCIDGSIDFSWRTNGARMLINIRYKEGVLYAYFYGDRKNNTMPIKGNFPLTEFYEPLAAWMKYLAE